MEVENDELGKILGLGLDGYSIYNQCNVCNYKFEYLNRSEWRVVYRDDYEVEGWTGSWSADELIQLLCRTSNGQVTEKEVRNLFGEAYNEGRNE